MSRLDELIAELCPDGVGYKTVGSVSRTLSPSIKIKSNDYLDMGRYPVIDQGQKYIGGFTNKDGAFKEGKYVIFGDHTCVVKYVDFPFVQGADGVKVIKATDEITPKFLYYCMCSIRIESGYARHWAKMRESFIPVPPLPVQHEIVRILDKFTEYSLERKNELKLREEQFRAYSTILFDKCKKERTVCLGELCFVEKGKTPIQKAISGKFPLVVTTAERRTCNDFQFSEPSVCVPLVSSRGHGVASLNHVYYQEGNFALGNILCALTPKDPNTLLAKYLYYYFEQTKDYTLVPLMKGGANVALRIDDIVKVKIPIPSIEQQRKIITTLQLFDDLCNNILPAEAVARQKQYEYYRDKLLSFKQTEVFQ